jgi:hypothetical protein
MARAATPSRWCVYQFHHFGIKDLYRGERGERREKLKVFSAGSATSAVNYRGVPAKHNRFYIFDLVEATKFQEKKARIKRAQNVFNP